MNSPILSIIIPVYNVEEYIERCLNSVISQTFNDYELLLIDDGSTDNSSVICKFFADKRPQRVRYIYKNNEGLGPTRDLGVNLSKGEYITFLDSDDWWAPEFCEQMINAMIKYDVDIAVCDINYLEEINNIRTQTVSKIRLPEFQKIIPREFPDSINRMRTFFWGKVFRRSLYIKSGLKQAEHKYEDFPVTSALVALSQSVCRVNLPMYFYDKCRKDNITNHATPLAYIADSIREMVENFKKLKLFDYYYKYIAKMAFSQVRFAIKKMDANAQSDQEQFKKSLHNSLFQVMNEYFPCWVNPSGLNICVCGSSTLTQIVSTFLFAGVDDVIDREKKYSYAFIDLLDNNEIYIKSRMRSHNIENYVIIRLMEPGRENTLKKQYDELIENIPDAITIVPDEFCDNNGHMEETAIWNIADLIWYKLFSGYKDVLD